MGLECVSKPLKLNALLCTPPKGKGDILFLVRIPFMSVLASALV